MSDRQEIRDLYEPEKSLDWWNPADWDDYAKTGIEYLDGLWSPYAKNVQDFLIEMGEDTIPLVGKISLSDYSDLYNNLKGKWGGRINHLMDPPEQASLPFGLGFFLQYRNRDAKDKAQRISSKYALSIDPNVPNIIEPMGLRNNPTPWNFSKVDTTKFTPRSNWGIPPHQVALNKAFEHYIGNLHYANPELRTAWRSNPAQTPVPMDPVSEGSSVMGVPLEPAGHTATAPFPEGYLYNPKYFNQTSPIDLGFGIGDDWNSNPENVKKQVLNALMTAIGGQESDHGQHPDTYIERPGSGALGYYQFVPTTWDNYVKDFLATNPKGTRIFKDGSTINLDELKNPEDWDRNNDQHQHTIAGFALETLLDKFKGDIGAVAMDHGAGNPAVHETYYPEEAHPDKLVGEGVPRQQYIAEVVRAFWYLMQGMENEHLTPEEIMEQNLGPYLWDEAGELIRFKRAS
tara:strand:- start:1422 stop:2795 length:1374 start_codon:yes stop_codon:yes gene_type:complete